MPSIVLLANLAATLAMTGLIWFVQVVHYPLFAEVGGLARYETLHATRTGWVVAPLMLVELATAIALLVPRLRPVSISSTSALVAAELVVARLVATNWIRTLAWTARAAIVLAWTAAALRR